MRRRVDVSLFIVSLVLLVASGVTVFFLLRSEEQAAARVLDEFNPDSEIPAQPLDTSWLDHIGQTNRTIDYLRNGGRQMFLPEDRQRCDKCGQAGFGLLPFATACGACGYWVGPGTREEYGVAFKRASHFIAKADAVMIELVLGRGEERRQINRRIEDPSEVASFLTMAPKERGETLRCCCYRTHQMNLHFYQGTNRLGVTVCQRCFDAFWPPDGFSDQRITVQFAMSTPLWQHLTVVRSEMEKQVNPEWERLHGKRLLRLVGDRLVYGTGDTSKGFVPDSPAKYVEIRRLSGTVKLPLPLYPAGNGQARSLLFTNSVGQRFIGTVDFESETVEIRSVKRDTANKAAPPGNGK